MVEPIGLGNLRAIPTPSPRLAHRRPRTLLPVQLESATEPSPVLLVTGTSIEDERKRFADMLNGRCPTGQEVAKHEARLLQIHNERGGKTDELLRWETLRARASADHPDCRGSAVEHVNGPQAKPTYAAGSLQWRRRGGKKTALDACRARLQFAGNACPRAIWASAIEHRPPRA